MPCPAPQHTLPDMLGCVGLAVAREFLHAFPFRIQAKARPVAVLGEQREVCSLRQLAPSGYGTPGQNFRFSVFAFRRKLMASRSFSRKPIPVSIFSRLDEFRDYDCVRKISAMRSVDFYFDFSRHP